jgi:transcriptional regulator with XRE-family HTH domain
MGDSVYCLSTMLPARQFTGIVGRVSERDRPRGDRPKRSGRSARPPGDHVGQRIRRAYEAAGYNRHSFAAKIGVAYTTLFSWEKEPGTKGAKTPKLDNIELVADALNVPMHQLTGERPTTVEPVWDDRKAWTRLEQRGRIDEYRARGVGEDQIQAARRYPFRGEPTEGDYEQILDRAELNVQRQEPAPAREAREQREREGGPDLSNEIKPPKR